jgi:hypothetical protein
MRVKVTGKVVGKPTTKIAKTFTLATFVIAGGLIWASRQDSSHAAAVIFQCTNSSSGATWNVNVDLDRNTVDSFPALISKSNISWRDTLHGGAYDLDRASGVLTLVNASSTGGYILVHHCHSG